MFLSLLLIIIITAGGFGLTYLLENERTFMWRSAAGNIIGSAVFGLICFLLSNFAGLNYFSIGIAALLICLFLFALRAENDQIVFKHDWDKAKGRIERFTFGRLKNLAYYVFFLVLFAAFFDRAMMVTDNGIFTGASNNLGDLPFHLGAIFSFSDGNNFPPQNPSFSGAKFTYPFIADFLSAVFVKLGMSAKGAMLLQNVTWAFSLLVIIEKFAASITNSRLAGKIAPFLLFFSGGLGFVWFLKDYWLGSQGIFEILWNLPKDYTIGEQLRWGNSMVVLFITQRSLLLGMPLALIVIHRLWDLVASGNLDPDKQKRTIGSSFIYGLIAGTLPLIHAHSLLVLFVISAFLFFVNLRNWKSWFAFGGGTALTGGVLLAWMLTGSASGTGEFFAWHFGFDSRGGNIVWFWIKNTGLFIPLALAGLGMKSLLAAEEKEDKGEPVVSLSMTHLWFVLPFVFIFVVSNVAKFAPWEWDNIKLLIYWFVGMLPFAAYLIVWIWNKGGWFRIASAAFLAVLVGSGALDVWRTASAQMEYGVFDQDAVKIAREIRERTKPDALFLNAPTYNTSVVLTGRRSLMRYIGHLSSHGINYQPRETDLKRIYAGEATADILLKKYGIDYVLVSPLERQALTVNDEYFARHQLMLESGGHRVYKIVHK